MSSIGYADICSDKLEKIYIPFSTEIISGSFRNSSNLMKVVSIRDDYYINGFEYSIKRCYSREVYIERDTLVTVTLCLMYHTSIIMKQKRITGYYWIDDWDYGSKIEFIPPEPEREGYTFGGWYKEPECINEWNFETDVLPEERTEINEEGEEEVVYQETKLYAKWV